MSPPALAAPHLPCILHRPPHCLPPQFGGGSDSEGEGRPAKKRRGGGKMGPKRAELGHRFEWVVKEVIRWQAVRGNVTIPNAFRKQVRGARRGGGGVSGQVVHRDGWV